MFKWLRIVLFQPIYPPHRNECGSVPDYLTLREIADLPPHHPDCDKDAQRR